MSGVVEGACSRGSFVGILSYGYDTNFVLSQIIQFLSGELDDSHVLELSRRITSQSELLNLGINGLRLRENIIDAAVYRHPQEIQNAAHDVLKEWVKRQSNRVDAYHSLLRCLKQCEMNELARDLRKLAVGPVDSDQSEYCYYRSQTKFAKVMFLHLSVILFTVGERA